jgi:hypothetical protein
MCFMCKVKPKFYIFVEPLNMAENPENVRSKKHLLPGICMGRYKKCVKSWKTQK